MKGILLAGGNGTRLYPVTKSISKQLIPIYDKPMIYYPLSVLMIGGIRDILIITTPNDLNQYMNLLGDGSDLGLNLTYKIQKKPNGLAEAFIIGEDFIGSDPVCLILGDNIFYGDGLQKYLTNAIINTKENICTVFGYYVTDPERYGVVGFDSNEKVNSIEEKPKNPKSNYAITGLYFYTNDVIQIAKNVKPSKRGEIEISSINESYLNKGNLSVELLGRGYAWLDTGTHDSLNDASNLIRTTEKRLGLKIGCIEEIAFQKKWITEKELQILAKRYKKTEYGDYLYKLLKLS